MADIKIQELTNETDLTDNHLFITQEDSDIAETKKTTLSLLKSFLNMLDFSDISQYFAEGTNVHIDIDNDAQKITISASATGEKGDKGDKGDDGVSPIVTIEQTETGATISIADSKGTTTTDITNGVTPHIDDTTKHWFIGETDTGVLAEGQDGISPTITVEQTETGCTITTVSGEATTTAELKNGITTIQTTCEIFTGSLLVENWIGDTAPYTQTVTNESITADIVADFGIILTQDNIETALNEKKQWSYITTINTIDGGIIFSCYEKKPTVQLNYKMRVV